MPRATCHGQETHFLAIADGAPNGIDSAIRDIGRFMGRLKKRAESPIRKFGVALPPEEER